MSARSGHHVVRVMSQQYHEGPMAVVKKHAVFPAELLVCSANRPQITVLCTQSKPMSCSRARMYTYSIPTLPIIRTRDPNAMHHAHANTNSWRRSLSRNLLCHRGGSRARKTAHSVRHSISRSGSGLPDCVGSLLCGVSERSVACPVVE